MNKACFLLLSASLAGTGVAQQVNSATQESASSSTSVAAGRSGANVQSNNNANASSETGVTAPERHREAKEAAETKRRGRSKKEPDGSKDSTANLAAGTTMNAVLAKPLDSSKCKPGDPVVATAAQDVKSDDTVVIRRGSRLIGHVTEAKSRRGGEANSSLGIVFDHAVLKNGKEVQMNSVVQALAAAQASPIPSAGDDSFGAAGAGTIAAAGRAGGGGPLGGVAGAAGAAANTVGNVGGGATGAVNSTVGSTVGSTRGLDGALSSSSTGVIGLKGLSLASGAANSTQGSVITSPGKSVHLDSGTRMVLRAVDR